MYPVRYEADFIEPQNRWKAFFRLILAIPWLILASVYGTIAYIVAFLAWFAIVFTGRYPQGLYNFQAGYLRYAGRVSAYTLMQTEQWPPFGFDDDRSYQVRIDVDPRLERYNRWKTGFRLILAFPVFVMLYVIPYLAQLGAVIAWLHIVFMGRTSGGVHNAITVGNAYLLRSQAYLLLVTERIPPVSDQAPAANQVAPAAPAKALPGGSQPAPAAPAAKPKAAAKKTAAKKAPAKKTAAKGKATPKRKPSAGR